MAVRPEFEHYIPLHKADLIRFLLGDGKIERQEQARFLQLLQSISAIWHHEFLARLEALKKIYHPFNPDAATVNWKGRKDPPAEAPNEDFFSAFLALTQRANFRQLTHQDVKSAIDDGASDWGVNMEVDWSAFDRLELFARGDKKCKRTRNHWIFWWRVTEKSVDTYGRLIVAVKLKKTRGMPPGVDTRNIYLKMFKEVPKLDLEMILPGSRVQMPWQQKWKMGGSLLGTLGYGLYRVVTEILDGLSSLLQLTWQAASTGLGILWGPFLLLAGYGYKQYAGYQVARQTYSKQLVESLYFQNLDNNEGVITHLLDEAEDQEFRETILAYYYLLKYAPPAGWSAEQLDDFIEMDMEGKLEMKIDFEVDDALAKLEELQLARSREGIYQAVPITDALRTLKARWEGYMAQLTG